METGQYTEEQKKHILIVDDDPVYATLVRSWLKDTYLADVVTSGEFVLPFVHGAKTGMPVDLILLDYDMPVMDGPRVFAMLQEDPDSAGIPVIFLTGVETKEALARIMDLKPAGYLTKTATKESILSHIRSRLE
ncbi:MAG: response regulator [Lachnospiraceae bacterium]|nr:response regulator [Lachnospiraceae bacterium]